MTRPAPTPAAEPIPTCEHCGASLYADLDAEIVTEVRKHTRRVLGANGAWCDDDLAALAEAAQRAVNAGLASDLVLPRHPCDACNAENCEWWGICPHSVARAEAKKAASIEEPADD